MKTTLAILILATLPPIYGATEAPKEKATFENPGSSKKVKDFNKKLLIIYKKSGREAGIQFLDNNFASLTQNLSAAQQYNILHRIQSEATLDSGRQDLEWSGALLEWAYQYVSQVGFNHFKNRIFHDLYPYYIKTGNYSKAREILTTETVFMAESGLTDLEITRLPYAKPEHSDFPAFKMRKLPRKNSWNTHPASMTTLCFIARQDLAEGKWMRALEEASIPMQKGQRFSGKKKNPSRNLKGLSADRLDTRRQALAIMAETYHFARLYDLELREYQSINTGNTTDGWATHFIVIAQAHTAYLECMLNKKPLGEAIAKLEKLSPVIQKNHKLPSDEYLHVQLMMAQMYFHHQQPDKGWVIINELVNSEKTSFNLHFLIEKEWCLQRVAENNLKDVEPRLLKLLETSRTGGVKREEIDLYEIYAKFLAASGRHDESLTIQQEYLRLLNTFNLFPRKPQALRGLADIYAKMNEAKAAKNANRSAQATLRQSKYPDNFTHRINELLQAPLPKKDAGYQRQLASQSDIQPRAATVAPIEGLPTRGLFTLKNLTTQPISGKLELRGKGITLTHTADHSLIRVTIGSPHGKNEVDAPIKLPEGELTFLDILLDEKGQQENQLKITWTPDHGESIQSEWSAQAGYKGENLSIVDAAEYLENPFYLIPFYHLLQYKDDFEQAMDLRIVSSIPTRIEIYDPSDAIVAVDAEGDGITTGRYDMVAQDFNKNGFPDFKLDKDSNESRFRYFVQPLAKIPAEGITFSLEIRSQGKWQKVSEDRLMAR